MKRLLAILALTLAISTVARAQTVPCSSGFNTSGSGRCNVSVNTGGPGFYIANHPASSLSGSAAILTPAGQGHDCSSFIYQTPVNVQAFTASFEFVPNAINIGFVIENQTNQPVQSFCSGAGQEVGFSQFAGGSNISPNNVWAMELDSYSPLTNLGSFVYSSVQLYQTSETPWLPLPNGGSYPGYLPAFNIVKISTSPVPLNSPATTVYTTTGDTYKVSLVYDGDTFTMNMYDETLNPGATCPGANCFTQSWTGVYIPEIVDGNTAYIGLTAGTSITPPINQLIYSFVYNAVTPTGTPSYAAYNANSTNNLTQTNAAATPVFSLAPGTYSGSQTLSMSSSTSNPIIIYETTSPGVAPSFRPMGNNGSAEAPPNGSVTVPCAALFGTVYSSPLTVSSSEDVYAITCTTFQSLPSQVVKASYAITGSGTVATPTFSPVAGTYTGTQSVAISTATTGASICYTTDGSTPAATTPGTCSHGTKYTTLVTVSASETINAIGTLSGDTNSSVGTAAYTINTPSGSMLRGVMGPGVVIH
jgi:hypothetical protein